MTIPFFSEDTGRSLLIQRGTDSYGEEGRRWSLRHVEVQEVVTEPRRSAGGRGLQYSVVNSWKYYANGLYQQTRSQLVQSEKMSVLGDLATEVADKINNPVGLNAVNLQPAAYEVFYVRS
ncbi:hypothetical protein [Nostoc sp.]|uniref:hypothetical protein n=1 Tax=Nostoc sp. TaxID=1180 RepID=UPI002FFB4BBB